MKEVSFIIPCYNSQATVAEVTEGIMAEMGKMGIGDYEIILVNDHSRDGTWNVLFELSKRFRHVKIINLARNYGQWSAVMAGLKHSSGKLIVTMDDDLQTHPSQLGKLFAKLNEGYDVVYARYPDKKHSISRNIGSFINNVMAQVLLGKPKELYVSSFAIFKSFVADEMRKYNNPYPYLLGIVLRSTSRIANVDVEHFERKAGKSNYNLFKLFALWLNGFTSYSVVPLRLATFVGFIFSFGGFAFMIYLLIRRIMHPDIPMGWTSVMTVLLFTSGILMCFLGLVGEYVGRIYICINQLPQFVIKEKYNFDSEIEYEPKNQI